MDSPKKTSAPSNASPNVRAFVVDNLATKSLLGQSFLTRLSSYEMRDGVLTLTW